MKHASQDDCWEGMLPAGMLPLPPMNKEATGREMIDEGMKHEASEIPPTLMDKLKSGAIKMAKNVKVIKKPKTDKVPSAREKK
jgi:hypothetical protein